MPPERSLIEALFPIDSLHQAIRPEFGRSRSHPSLMHPWKARRPLGASRAAVYATLVPPPEPFDAAAISRRFENAMVWDAPEGLLQPLREEILAANGGEPPKVLDMFAGGGALPLEAARLGCEAHAVELNPVAYVILLCTLVYPQRYGPSLADDVERWGEWMVERSRAEVGDLYREIRDNAGNRLTPVAYLWTRTVPCPNRAVGSHDAHLVRQTWLLKGKGAYTALRPTVDRKRQRVTYEVVGPVGSVDALGFDPSEGSNRGSTTCAVCGAPVGADWAKEEGKAGRMGRELMAVACVVRGERGKRYVAAADAGSWPSDSDIKARIAAIGADGLAPPTAPIPADDAKNFWTPLYGLTKFADLFTPRQLLTLLTFCKHARAAHAAMLDEGMDPDRATAVATYLGLAISRLSNFSSTICTWHAPDQLVRQALYRQAIPMTWDFPEVNPLADSSGGVHGGLRALVSGVRHCARTTNAAVVSRGSATRLPLADGLLDAIITDPPYYDNISYADLADYFYVWLQRAVGHLYPEDFKAETTPKRREIVVAPYRHADAKAAWSFYEAEMASAFSEANRVLKDGAPLVVIYAHKTTLGWATLVRALQKAGFTVTEAWPVETEVPRRVGQMNTASLASSIFLVSRKRASGAVGDADDVVNEVRDIVEERLSTLQAAGIAGADLVIAAIGAGLRAYTRFGRVERANGEELDPESYLVEVQRIVLEVWGRDLGVAEMDRASRFYVFAHREYGHAVVPFDEMNTLAHGVGVELSGGDGLKDGHRPLVGQGKNRAEARLLDFAARGKDDDLGLAGTPLIDVLHRLLWLRENRPGEVGGFLAGSQPDQGRLKTLAHALAGPALDGAGSGRTDEQHAIQRLLAAWPQVVERALEDATGQQRMTL